MKKTASPGRGGWKREAGRVVLILTVGTAVFWLTDLDILISALFFDPSSASPWVHADGFLWRLLYRSDDYLTLFLAAVALGLIVVGISRPAARRYIRYGIFIILSTALGSGLLVNTVLKDNWGRPRPADIEAFGGPRKYLPPGAMGPVPGEGKSFPSGHAAIGFSFLVFWFLERDRRPGRARYLLAGGLGFGLLMGAGRIVQGRHFASDVLWAGCLLYLVSLSCYRLILWPGSAQGD
jgi:membrane-associated PAP2 superfamily phosphatase